MKTDSNSGTKNEPSSAQSGEKIREKSPPQEEPGTGPVPHWAELTHHIRRSLAHIQESARLAEEKSVDKRFGQHFRRSLSRDVNRIDALLKEYGAYLKVNTPVEKKDTVHRMIDETLRKYQGLLQERRIEAFKKFEHGLPETIVFDEPLRFVLNSLFWYALTWIPSVARIVFFTRTLPLQIVTASRDGTIERKERHDLEILFVLSGRREPSATSGTPDGLSLPKREGLPGLMFRLIEEVVSRNQGELKVEVDSKKSSILFSLKFPVERRRRIFYSPPENG